MKAKKDKSLKAEEINKFLMNKTQRFLKSHRWIFDRKKTKNKEKTKRQKPKKTNRENKKKGKVNGFQDESIGFRDQKLPSNNGGQQTKEKEKRN